MTDSVHRPVDRSVERLGTPVGPPVGQEVLRTDGRDGRTYEESFSPTRDNPSSSVTRTRTYGFCPDHPEQKAGSCAECFKAAVPRADLCPVPKRDKHVHPFTPEES